ncbi:MAG: hypothetical protein K1X29_10265 [Bdellovibrionales bacterium]|nr:hypothetical protein [Bdellovibrionales bacterium]
MKKMNLGIIFFINFYCGFVQAQYEHSLVRRMTVFPVKAPKEYATQAEEAWWQVREILTENQRFLVASRNFLIQKDVFQPRERLSPADAIILGKLLDAQGLITIFLEDRVLHLEIYENEYGRVLWSGQLTLSSSQPIADQLVQMTRKLIFDFLSKIPYQGFVIQDPLMRNLVFLDHGKKMLKADVGSQIQVELGDEVQLIRIIHERNTPLFVPETPIEIFAQGIVVKVDKELITVELKRVAQNVKIKEFTLVRLPKEMHRLREAYGFKVGGKNSINSEYFSSEMSLVQQEVAEKKPLVLTMAFILNLATFLLFAF